MNDKIKPSTWLELSSASAVNNVRVIRTKLKPQTKLMAIVKANAYGHGMKEMIDLFDKGGADSFGVFSLEEALVARSVNAGKTIVILGPANFDRIDEIVGRNIEMVVADPKQLSRLPANVGMHIKLDTGLSRQGITIDELSATLSAIPAQARIVGVMSHLADAENLSDNSYSYRQLDLFNKGVEILNKAGYKDLNKHLIASDGYFTLPEAEFDTVRIGLILYGLWPNRQFHDKYNTIGLEPVLSWKTRIVQIRHLPKGSFVGYAVTERLERDTISAVLPVGYADGYDWRLAGKGYVLIRNQICKILGRISMNMTVVDVTEAVGAAVGDEVKLLGDGDSLPIFADDLALRSGTISYEIVTRINPLLPRVVK